MGDYISREAAVTEVCDRGKFYKKIHDRFGGTSDICASAHFEISELIMRLPAADVEPVRRWIPCRERLPEYDGQYLAFSASTCTINIRRFSIRKDAVSGSCGEKKNVWWEYDDELGVLQVMGITHWMPLPEPPDE